jgi:riboflavin biosynthesis pyrimidine reductase
VRELRAGDDVQDLMTPYRQVSRPPRGDRPWVLANMVGSLDGSAAVAGRVGVLSTPADAQLFRELRSVADVVLVGAETVRRERYGPVRLNEALQADRVRAGQSPLPPIAVVSRAAAFDWSIPLFADSDPAVRPLLVTCTAAHPAQLDEASQHAELVMAGESSVDVADALRQLRERGAGVVLCEGGPTLLGGLVAAGLLDELCLTITPVMGGDPLPLSVAPVGADLARFALAHTLVDDDGTLFLRYETVGSR